MSQLQGLENELKLALAAAALDASNAYGLIVVAEAFRTAGEKTRAVVIARRAVEINGSDPLVLAGAATVLQMTGDFAGSITFCEAVVRQRPSDAAARFQLAFGLLATREFPRALPHLHAYSGLVPDSALACRNHSTASEP